MKDTIKKVILEWQEEGFSSVINRSYHIEYTEEINTIIGLRRSGKTYIIYNEILRLVKQGIGRDQIVYLLFEDERLEPLESQQLDLIIEAYYELYPENQTKSVYLFFDEIQYIDNWELFIKRLYEKKRYKITLTGSSSKLSSDEIATELRGRTLSLNIYPLHFKEFLSFRGIVLSKNTAFSRERFGIIKHAEEFLRFGGLPRIALTHDELMKKELLKNYLDMIIFKDIVERYEIRNTHILKVIINYVLMNCSTPFSINSFINKLGSEYSLNKDTIFTYFSYLEEAGFIYYAPRFAYRVKERYLTKKIYIIDNGFLQLTVFKENQITGASFENLIFTELIKADYSVFFFRDKNNNECDFIARKESRETLAIQVSYTLHHDNKKREIRGLVAALEHLNVKEGILITKDQEETIHEDSYVIHVVPYWKWMLEINKKL